MRIILIVLCSLIPFACPGQEAPARRPVVMVHGFMASGDTWAKFWQYFTANGYREDQLYVLDWNTLSQEADHSGALDALINTAIRRTGANQVDLIGHSAGGALCYNYLSRPQQAAKVAHYAHIGSMRQQKAAGAPTLNLWSDGDRVAFGNDIAGATNKMLPGLDHYQIATSQASFAAVYSFFNQVLPDSTKTTTDAPITVAGRALSFAENKPAAGAAITIFYLDTLSGAHSSEPVARVVADTMGHWPPVAVEARRPMEFVVQPADGSKTIHYFREGVTQHNALVYLRTLPPARSMAGLLLKGLPDSASQAVFNIYSASQAVVAGRDSLTVDGTLLSSRQWAKPEKTAISYFLFDGNNNRKSDFSPVGIFNSFPFMNGVDLFFDPVVQTPVSVYFNGRCMRVPRIPASAGVSVIVFD